MSSDSAAARVPSYRRHKPTGQAVVTLNGKDHYLGKWNSKVSRVEYDRLIGSPSSTIGTAIGRLARIIHKCATAVSAVLPWVNRQVWSTADTAVARENGPDHGPMNNPG